MAFFNLLEKYYNFVMEPTNGRVFGGTPNWPNILIFGLFLDNLSISERTIDRALTIHTEL